ncbi:MAG: hypothetical protein R3F22_04445 [Lysobacteraceae bacterium]
MSDHASPASALKLLFGLMFAAGSSAVSAVEINPDGGGQAVISPLWATTGGHNTLMSVTSMINEANDAPQVAAFRLFDKDGGTVFAASIYFRRPGDQWTLGIGSAGNGTSVLKSNDSTCALVAGDGGPMPLQGEVQIDADYGYATVIGMGSVEGDVPRELMDVADCAALATYWNAGAWKDAPDEGLSRPALFDMETMMIAVEGGVLFDIPPTSLSRFSDIPQHRPPSNSLPNLGSAHDAGTAGNATTGRRCIDSNCDESTFSTPLEAMDYALSVPVLESNYLIEPSMAARTEVVFTAPLGRLKRDSGITGRAAYPLVGIKYFNRDGWHLGGSGGICPGVPPPGGCPWGFEIRQSVLALPVIPERSMYASDEIISEPSGIPMPDYEELPSYWRHFLPVIYPTSVVDYTAGRISAFNDAIWHGSGADSAVIGITLMQVTNGYLHDADGNRVLANYGKASAMRRAQGDQ